ncbi:hypothetical protein K9F62_11210 [Desulfovibrio sp. JY]|nr:hypothetical protein K9F62_11210 [Desulfovibrio sp. JY]
MSDQQDRHDEYPKDFFAKYFCSDVSIESLYIELAESVPGSGALGLDKLEYGKNIFNNFKKRSRSIICESVLLNEISADPGSNISDCMALAASIAAVIPSQYSTVINIGLASVLIVKVGVKNFCN